MPEQTPRILCIIGFGRSGSTVLDAVLGNHPGAESVGELVNLPSRGLTNNEYCACGVRARACPFWTAVWKRFAERSGVDDPAQLLALQDRFERIRRLPRLLRERRAPSAEFERYAACCRALYAALAEVSGKPVVVDSSKYAVRAFALSLVAGLDVRMLHLVRDPRGVTWSLAKPYKRDDAAGVQRDIAPRPARRTAWEWVKNNVVAEWVCRQVPPGHAVRVRYEDLTTDPAASLATIGRAAGLDLGDLARQVAEGRALEVGHPIAGNRVRMQGAIQLRADTEWHERLARRDRLVVRAVAGPLMARYGYGAPGA